MKNNNGFTKIFEDIFKNMPEAVAVYGVVDGGRDFIIKYFNKSAEKIEKVRSFDIVGKKITKAFPSVKKFGILKILNRVWKTGRSEKFPLGLYKDKRIAGWRDNYIFKLSSGEVAAIYTDETKNKQAEERLGESEARLRQSQERLLITLKSIGDAVMVTDGKGSISFLNYSAQKLTGWPEKQAVGLFLDEVFCIINEKTGKKIVDPVNKVIKTGRVVGLGNHTVLIYRGGKKVAIEDSAAPIKNGQGKVVGVVLVFHDVSEKREADKKLEKISNALKVVSKCNEALIHINKEQDLLNEICKIIINLGGYRFAWIGCAENNKDKIVRPVARAGFEKGYLRSARITWANNERGQGPTGTAIRTGKIVSCADIQTDPKLLPWRGAAAKRGYASSISLPFSIGRSVEAISIYAAEPNAFSGEQVKLLSQLTNDLSYGIKNIRLKNEQIKDQIKLKEEQKKYFELFNRANDAIFIADPKTRKVTDCNKAAEKLMGYSRAEILSMKADDLHPKDISDETMSGFKKQSAGKDLRVFTEVLTKNNERIPVSINAALVNIGGKKFIQGIFRDISGQKRAEDKLRESQERYKSLFDLSNDSIFLMDKNIFIECNEKTLEMFGCRREQIVGKPPYLFSPKKQPDGSLSIVSAKKRINLAFSGKPQFFEWRHSRLNKKEFDAEVSLKRIDINNKKFLLASVRDISERKLNEKIIKESEEKFRNIFENSGVGVSLVGLDGKWLKVNKKLCEITGYSEEELVRSAYLKVTHPDDIERTKNFTRDLITGKIKKGEIEKRYIHKKGHIIWAHLNVSMISDLNKRPLYFETITTDITKQKEAGEKLKESKLFFEESQRAAHIGSYKTDFVAGFWKSSEVLDKIFGIDKNYKRSISGWLDIVHPDDREMMNEYLTKEVITKKKPFDKEYRITRKRDGATRWVRGLGRINFDSTGRILSMTGTIQDITESKRSEKFLLDKELELEQVNIDLMKFKMAVDNASDDIIITDPRGIILYTNYASEINNGYPISEIVGKTPSVWGKQMPKEFYVNFWKTIKEEKRLFVGEITNKRKNGELYIAELKVSPILNNKKEIQFFVGISRDITKAKELDRAKSEFVSVASHQLKTPVSGIKWMLESILQNRENNLTEKQRTDLKDVYEDNEKMINLINDLLNISRIDSGKYAMLNLSKTEVAPLVEKALKDLNQFAITRNVKFEFKNELPMNYSLNIDSDKIYQVILNLVSNSIKYSKLEGGISKITTTIKNGEFVFSVKDNGIGIPIQNQRHIFEKFYRAENASVSQANGSGLGLYIGKYFVESHKGKIWFKSKEGIGTTFAFTLRLDLI